MAESEHRDIVESLERVVGHLAHRRVHRERNRNHEQRVAVGRRTRHDLGADDAVRARTIVDHHLPAEALG